MNCMNFNHIAIDTIHGAWREPVAEPWFIVELDGKGGQRMRQQGRQGEAAMHCRNGRTWCDRTARCSWRPGAGAELTGRQMRTKQNHAVPVDFTAPRST